MLLEEEEVSEAISEGEIISVLSRIVSSFVKNIFKPRSFLPVQCLNLNYVHLLESHLFCD